MKKYQFLFIALTTFHLLISCGNIKNYTDSNFPKFSGNYTDIIKNETNNLKVVSFNIKFSNNTKQAIEELSTNKDLNNSDIILLQEMDETDVAFMAKKLKLYYLYFPACLQRYNKDFGNAILSKWPMRNSFKLILPHKNPINNQQRIASAADLLVGNKTIRVYSIHTEVAVLSVEDRVAQVNAVIRSIPDSIDHVIVGGDFNTLLSTTTKRIDKLFNNKNLYQATKDISFSTKMGPLGLIHLKLDHIFVRGMSVTDSGVYEESTASDHLPIWADFALN